MRLSMNPHRSGPGGCKRTTNGGRPAGSGRIQLVEIAGRGTGAKTGTQGGVRVTSGRRRRCLGPGGVPEPQAERLSTGQRQAARGGRCRRTGRGPGRRAVRKPPSREVKPAGVVLRPPRSRGEPRPGQRERPGAGGCPRGASHPPGMQRPVADDRKQSRAAGVHHRARRGAAGAAAKARGDGVGGRGSGDGSAT